MGLKGSLTCPFHHPSLGPFSYIDVYNTFYSFDQSKVAFQSFDVEEMESCSCRSQLFLIMLY